MAPAAICPEFPIMYVVRAVASAATAVDGLNFFQWTAVTIITSYCDVGTCNWEFRLQVVVECPLVPADRVVTISTGLIEITSMRVFLFVAGNTFRFGASKGLVRMAFSALLFAVNSE